MKAPAHVGMVFVFLFLIPCSSVTGEDQVQLQFRKQSAAQGEVILRSQMALPVSSMYAEYSLEQSSDLVHWSAVGEPVSGTVGASDEVLRVQVSALGSNSFYRAVAKVKVAESSSGLGEAVFGYTTAFAQQLAELGQLPLAEFVSKYAPTNLYLPQVTFDPAAAEFWDLFNANPAEWNATNWANRRSFDFRLTPAEMAVLRTNGFVVSQRLERQSFADVYYDLYNDHLPVFVTADSILQAWHRSMVTMLAEVEETCFVTTLSNVVTRMSAQLPALRAEAAGTPLASGVLDADFFLAVAKSLLTGINHYGAFGQTARIQAALTAINGRMPRWINLYGEPRLIDFSQFVPRGHYANSYRFQLYFRAMMWCALADFRYAGLSTGTEPSRGDPLRELSGALAMHFLLRSSGTSEEWFQFNRTLEMLVGTPDSLTCEQLDGLLQAAGVRLPSDLPTQESLTNLQSRLMTGELGFQQITSGMYYSPFSAAQTKLPRSFCFMGQRFVMDSWALSKTTFDRIIWDENGIPEFSDKVLRRWPSALDVAFAVLGNSQTVSELAMRIARRGLTTADGREYWRDGRFYQHNLAAVRNVIDQQNAAAWTNSIYNHWLSCLRQLSEPTTDERYPQAMRTRAWAMKTLNTQLASWTHLRHTTALYVKESYAAIILCMYPKGYVEPLPAFWSRVGAMAMATKSVLATLPTNGVFEYVHYTNNASGEPQPYKVAVSGASMHANRLALMDRFAGTMEVLRSLSEKELNRTPFSASDEQFLTYIMGVDYLGRRTYRGWYPRLFYEPGCEYIPPDFSSYTADAGDDKGSDFWDPVATTVYTEPPDAIAGDNGGTLHEAVGNVQVMLVVVDCGPADLAMYAGPVLSHYEFGESPTTRLTDTQWKSRITKGQMPAAPEWTRSYLVPK